MLTDDKCFTNKSYTKDWREAYLWYARISKKNTSYDGASLRSPIVEKGVMLGVLPDSDDGTWAGSEKAHTMPRRSSNKWYAF